MRLTILPSIVLATTLAAGALPLAQAADAPQRTPVPAQDLGLSKPLYHMQPREAGTYIAWIHDTQPDLRKRIAAIGRKNLGQPYLLNLLGEFPYQVHDELPMFRLDRSDCVVFVENTYAMAISQSWEEFFWMLQRIRYRDGIVGVTTRNHYTEVDWNVANRWLVTDISAQLAGPNGPTYTMTVDRAAFLQTQHRTRADIPVEQTRQAYVPKEQVNAVAAQLQEGDYFNVISSRGGQSMATHVGLIVLGPHDERRILHSSEPEVREETFDAYIARAAAREERDRQAGKDGKKLLGFKFLRLNSDIVVPPMAPQPRPTRAAIP